MSRYVTVEISLNAIDDDDLIKEIEDRGYAVDSAVPEIDEDLRKIYQLRRLGKSYDDLLDKVLKNQLGVVL